MARFGHNRIRPEVIAMNLDNAKRIGPDGHISFQSAALDDASTVLFSCLTFDSQVPDRERQRIIREAIFRSTHRKPVTWKSLEREINRSEATYLARPLVPYVLATSMSIRSAPWNWPGRLSLHRSTVTFSRVLPKSFDRSALFKLFPKEPNLAVPKDFLILRVSVRARSVDEAGQLALDTLDFLRGVWNLSLNLRVVSRGMVFGGRQTPINRIRLGPIHTLHQPDGRPAGDTYWYDPFYAASSPEWLDDGTVKRLLEETAVVRSGLTRIPYGRDLRQMLVRYARALDSADFEKVFLNLWALLEELTGAGNQGYDQVIRRAMFVWQQSDLAEAVLEHLRTYRNASVHSGVFTDQVHDFAFQLKRYVEALLLFHISSKPAFRSVADAGDYLQLPQDPKTLRIQIAKRKRALRFRLGG